MTGNALARHGSTVISSPSLNWRMWSWQAVVCFCGPWGRPLMTMLHDAADALAAVVVEGDRVLALSHELFVEHVEHLEEGHVLRHLLGVVGHEAALRTRRFSGARR